MSHVFNLLRASDMGAKAPDDTALDIAGNLRQLADQAIEGEIVEVVVVFRTKDGDSGHYQSASEGYRYMAGAMLEAACERLGFVRA